MMVQIIMVQVGIKLESQPNVMELCAYITSTLRTELQQIRPFMPHACSFLRCWQTFLPGMITEQYCLVM